LIRLWKTLFRRPDDFGHGSLLVAVEQALESVREGSIDDEVTALSANKIVRKCLDKRAIKYDEYKKWRKRNHLIFTPIVDQQNQLIGFFDIFPLTLDAGERIVAGTLTERSLAETHILPFADTSTATHIHIATILLNPNQTSFSPVVAREVLLLKMKEFIDRNYSPVETRTYTAFAQSKTGEAFLNRCEFSMVVFSHENDQKLPLYVLRPADTQRAIFRFSQAEKRISSSGTKRANLARLDLSIEQIELSLRSLITSALNGDTTKLPGHIAEKINDKLRLLAKKDVAVNMKRYDNLEAKLEFADMRELQDIILAKSLWVHFQAQFADIAQHRRHVGSRLKHRRRWPMGKTSAVTFDRPGRTILNSAMQARCRGCRRI
jgi:hypothetical protein